MTENHNYHPNSHLDFQFNNLYSLGVCPTFCLNNRVKCAAAIKLDRTDLKEINDAVENIEVKGDRYPEQLQKLINR